jgi:hypothetical protein
MNMQTVGEVVSKSLGFPMLPGNTPLTQIPKDGVVLYAQDPPTIIVQWGEWGLVMEPENNSLSITALGEGFPCQEAVHSLIFADRMLDGALRSGIAKQALLLSAYDEAEAAHLNQYLRLLASRDRPLRPDGEAT